MWAIYCLYVLERICSSLAWFSLKCYFFCFFSIFSLYIIFYSFYKFFKGNIQMLPKTLIFNCASFCVLCFLYHSLYSFSIYSLFLRCALMLSKDYFQQQIWAGHTLYFLILIRHCWYYFSPCSCWICYASHKISRLTNVSSFYCSRDTFCSLIGESGGESKCTCEMGLYIVFHCVEMCRKMCLREFFVIWHWGWEVMVSMRVFLHFGFSFQFWITGLLLF